MAAWQGRAHGNQSACGGADVAGVGDACPNPGGLLTTPGGPAFTTLFRVYPGPSSTPLFPEEVLVSHGKSAYPVGSIFQSYPGPDPSLALPLSLLWFTAQVSSLGLCRSLLTGLPAPTLFSFCNLLYPCLARNNLASWDLRSVIVAFSVMSSMSW